MADSNNWVIVDAPGYPGEKRFYNKSTGEYSYGNPTGPLGGYWNPADPASDRRALGYFFEGIADHFDPNSAKYNQTQTKDGSIPPRTSSLNPYAAGPDGKPSDYLDPVKKSDTSKPTSTSTSTSTSAPTRTPEPLATTFAGAVESLGPGPFGRGRTFGSIAELPWPEYVADQPGWNTEIDTSVLPESAFSRTDVNPDIYNSSEGLPEGVGFNTDVDLNTGLYDTELPQSQPMTGLQALRADEESRGLIYASGKYWADNADGKLEAIPTDLVNGEGTARQQAIAFMESKMQPIIDDMNVNPNIFDSSKDLPEEVGFNNVDLDIGTNNFSGIHLPGSQSIDPSVWEEDQEWPGWEEMPEY